MGKLIVIEGVDGSGKATQTQLLYDALAGMGRPVRKITFPNYQSPFAEPVKQYLAGALGEDPAAVNAYAASTFYAIDRYASFQQDWGAFYGAGGVVVADRYVTSNIVHQAAKLTGDKRPFIDWLTDLEYDKLGLPRPDLVLFLDMPPEHAAALTKARANKFTGGQQKDIHERNADYIQEAYENALSVADLCGWRMVRCVADGVVREISDIAAEILGCTVPVLEK